MHMWLLVAGTGEGFPHTERLDQGRVPTSHLIPNQAVVPQYSVHGRHAMQLPEDVLDAVLEKVGTTRAVSVADFAFIPDDVLRE